MITSFWVDQNLAAHITDREAVLSEISRALREYDKRACASSRGVDEKNYKANVQYLVHRTFERHEPSLVKVAKTSVSLSLSSQVEATIYLSVDPQIHMLVETNNGLTLKH